MPEGEVIAEALCDAVEEIPWRKVVKRISNASGTDGCHINFTGEAEPAALCRGSSTQTSEAGMDGFNETDAANLQRVKDAMAEKAVAGGVVSGPDAAAASAFAALLDSETRREELRLKYAGVDKGQGASAASSWTDAVSGGRQASTDSALAA
jgi:hypothetical protein